MANSTQKQPDPKKHGKLVTSDPDPNDLYLAPAINRIRTLAIMVSW